MNLERVGLSVNPATGRTSYARYVLWALLGAGIINALIILNLTMHGEADPGTRHGEMIGAVGIRMRSCVDRVLGLVGETRPTLPLYNAVWNICANEVYSLDSLADYDIRKEKVLRQELDERIMLWMVVSVTVSGVLLAAVQLLASFRLATQGRGELSQSGELSIERGNIALKSSVTGLFILAFSLAFFGIYVKWIYPMEEVAISQPALTKLPTGVIKDEGGELGLYLGNTTGSAGSARKPAPAPELPVPQRDATPDGGAAPGPGDQTRLPGQE